MGVDGTMFGQRLRVSVAVRYSEFVALLSATPSRYRPRTAVLVSRCTPLSGMAPERAATATAAAAAAAAAVEEAKRVVADLHVEQARLQAELAHVRVRLALGVRALAAAQRKADAATKAVADGAQAAKERVAHEDANEDDADDEENSSSSSTSDTEDEDDAKVCDAATAGQPASVDTESVAAAPTPPPVAVQEASAMGEEGGGSAGVQQASAHPLGPLAAPKESAVDPAVSPEGEAKNPPTKHVKTRRPWTRTPDTWCKGCLYRVCAMPGGRPHDPPGLGRCLQELPPGTPHPPLPEGFVAAPPAKRGRPPRKRAA